MIQKEITNKLAIVTLDIGKGNTFALNDIQELYSLVSDIENSLDIEGMILTGSKSSFSTGGNVDYIRSLSSKEEVLLYFGELDKLLLKLFSFKKPFCAAVNGHAIGLGFLIMLCADFIIITEKEKIKFGLPEINIGMVIDGLMLEIVNFHIGDYNKLSQLIYKGDLLDKEKLKNLSIIHNQSIHETLLSESIIILEEIIKTKYYAFLLNKALIREKSMNLMENFLETKNYEVFLHCFKF